MIGCLLFSVAITLKAISVQIVRDPRLERMANRQFQSKLLIQPKRGAIIDRYGEPLAFSVESKSLAIDPSKIQDKRLTGRLISKALKIPYAKIIEKIKEPREFVWVKRQLEPSEITRLEQTRLIAENGRAMPGLLMIAENARRYPHHELADRLIGSVNIDSEGHEGVELLFNDTLQGDRISVKAVRDARGRPTFIDADAAKSAREGKNVQLTIDSSLQFNVQALVEQSVQRKGAKAGTAIVMNADTGEILAMATVSNQHRRNSAFTDGYEPGSTLKAVLLSAALQKGMTIKDRLWGERGSIKIQGKTISEAEAHERFEWVSLREMIQLSSNVVAAKLALKVGTDSYLNTLKAFEFGSKTQSGFPGEYSGRIPARKEWGPLALATIGFGQGISVTPIQMLRAYAAFANGGYLVRPKFIIDATKPQASTQRKQVISTKSAEGVTEALVSVTEGKGTGVNAALSGYKVAGKTGTAQKVDPNTRRYANGRYISSFIGYPVGVSPRVVIFTAIDEPQGVYYASETAAPLFKDVLQATVNRMNIPANSISTLARTKLAEIEKPIISKQSAPLLPTMKMGPVATPIQVQTATSNESGAAIMPNLRGITAREALKILEKRVAKIEMIGTGIVEAQYPEPGRSIGDSSVVRLKLGETNP